MFNKRLSVLLKKKSIKNSQLAEQLGVSRSAVTKWLKGEAEPRPDVIRHLAQLLEVSVGYLMNNEKEPRPINVKDGEGATFASVFPLLSYSEIEPDCIEGQIWVPIYETQTVGVGKFHDMIGTGVKAWHSAPSSLGGGYGGHPFMRPFTVKLHGDYITFIPGDFDKSTPNTLYAVKVDDNDGGVVGVLIKKIMADYGRQLYILQSDNPQTSIYLAEFDKVSVIAKAVSLWRPL